MDFLNRRVIIIAVIIVLSLLFVFGYVLRQKPPPQTTLSFWGTGENQSALRQLIFEYQKEQPGIQIQYREFSEESYEEDLIDGLAGSRPPDFFLFHNSWLPKHFDKLRPLTEEQLPLSDFRRLYPQVVEQDFAPAGAIYALPLYLDTLALLYNAERFDQLAIAQPPKNWITMTSLKENRGLRASTSYAADSFSLFLLQSGLDLSGSNGGRIFFSGETGKRTLAFYEQLVKYSPQAREELILGEADLIFGYNRDRLTLKEKNPWLRLAVGAFPQYAAAAEAVNLASYYGLAVSGKSAKAPLAWDFIKFLAAQSDINQKYLELTGQPPALRGLINQYQLHPELNIFSRQALTARSWPRVDPTAIERIFSRMLESTQGAEKTPGQALLEAEGEINQLIQRKERF